MAYFLSLNDPVTFAKKGTDINFKQRMQTHFKIDECDQ